MSGITEAAVAGPLRGRAPAAVGLVLAAAAVAVLVFSVLSVSPPAQDLPDVSLVDGAGRPFSLPQLAQQVWVGAFASADAPGAPLSELAESLPERVPLVTFVLSAESAGPGAFAGGGLVLGGERATLAEIATGHLGFTPAELDAAAGGAAYLLACVDRAGRVSRKVVAATSGPVGSEMVSRTEFLLALERRPRLHALLNGCSAVLLVLGFAFIRARRVGLHLTCMLLAVATTTGFLVSYLYYHFHAGSTPFEGAGWARPLYFGMLITHTTLAAFVVPLAGTVLFHAARQTLDRHRRLARWTLPLWLYVSVTGVLIYLMLHVWF